MAIDARDRVPHHGAIRIIRTRIVMSAEMTQGEAASVDHLLQTVVHFVEPKIHRWAIDQTMERLKQFA